MLFVAIAITLISDSSGLEGSDTFFSNFTHSFFGAIGALAGTLTLFFGLFGILKNKERSVLVYIATLIGLVIFFFFMADIFSQGA